jgi:hypothetical protein
MAIYLFIVYGCFPITMTDLSHWNGSVKSYKSKICTVLPSKKVFQLMSRLKKLMEIILIVQIKFISICIWSHYILNNIKFEEIFL